jgi:hypothetical protein
MVTGTPYSHIEFGALTKADDPDKLKQMIPGMKSMRWSKAGPRAQVTGRFDR